MELTDGQRKLLFWASFLSLAAVGVNFAFRIAKMGEYGVEFDLTGQQIGNIIGSCFWPIAITMILFSLIVDKTGYRWPMFGAAALQIASGLGTYFATSYEMLLLSAISVGLGHGIVEAVINPACAAAYPKAKTKMLTILHASWPAGVVGGTLMVIGSDAVTGGLDWRIHALWILIPAIIFGLMFIPAKFPVDERVAAGVPFKDMLKEVGFMGMALAGFMLFYQIGGEVLSGIFGVFEIKDQATWFYTSLAAGVIIGGIFGIAVGSVGKPLFFLLCLLMIPVATAELSTDGWIKELMNPVLGEYAVWAIVFSAGVMFLLRMFAGGVLRFFNPPMLMATSGVLSAAGLYWLGTGAAGIAIFVAFLIYAIGQTYYWPCILGFVAERFPRGGALTLNLVSAMALLSLGIVGNPILGVARDKSVNSQSEEVQSDQFVEVTQTKSPYLWMKNDVIDASQFPVYGATKIAGEGEAVLAALKPMIQGDEELAEAIAEMNKGLDAQAENEQVTERWAELGITRADLQAIKTYQLVKKDVKATEPEEQMNAAMASLQAALPEASKDGLEAFDDVVAKHGELTVNAGRDVLVFAAIFPGILVVCFAGIAIYFRSIGGYKPVELLKNDPENTKDHVVEAPGSEL